jgi:hypothetical protein
MATMRSDSTKADIQYLSAFALSLFMSRSDKVLFDKSQAIARICRLATDEEEQRRVIQLRALRNFRELAEQYHIALDQLSIANLCKALV